MFNARKSVRGQKWASSNALTRDHLPPKKADKAEARLLVSLNVLPCFMVVFSILVRE